MMRHRKTEKLLAVYRSLDAGQRQRVDAHVQTCPSCTARLAAYGEMDRALLALPSPAPDQHLRNRVLDTVAGYAGTASQSHRNRQPIPRALSRVAAVALVLVLGSAAVLLVRNSVRTPTVEPSIVQPVLGETPTPGLTPAAVQTAEASGIAVPAEIRAVIDEVVQQQEGQIPGTPSLPTAPTIHRFRQADNWALVDVSYGTVYEGTDSPPVSKRQAIALLQAADGRWQPSELIYMPENVLHELWGPEKTLNLRTVDLIYYEFDEPFVYGALAESDFDAFVDRAAANLQLSLDAGPRLALTIAPDRSALWQDEALLQVDGLSDIPLGDLALTPTYGVFTPSVPVPSASEITSVAGSTDLDVGLTIFSRLRRAVFLELARRAAGEPAQAIDELPALVSQLAMWEAGPPVYPVGRDRSMAMWAALPAELRQLPSLSELLAPKDTVYDSFLWDVTPYSKAMVFLAFVEEQYGEQAFGPLVRALVSQDTWQDVVRAVFDEDPVQFETQWQQWVASAVR